MATRRARASHARLRPRSPQLQVSDLGILGVGQVWGWAGLTEDALSRGRMERQQVGSHFELQALCGRGAWERDGCREPPGRAGSGSEDAPTQDRAGPDLVERDVQIIAGAGSQPQYRPGQAGRAKREEAIQARTTQSSGAMQGRGWRTITGHNCQKQQIAHARRRQMCIHSVSVQLFVICMEMTSSSRPNSAPCSADVQQLCIRRSHI